MHILYSIFYGHIDIDTDINFDLEIDVDIDIDTQRCIGNAGFSRLFRQDLELQVE